MLSRLLLAAALGTGLIASSASAATMTKPATTAVHHMKKPAHKAAMQCTVDKKTHKKTCTPMHHTMHKAKAKAKKA